MNFMNKFFTICVFIILISCNSRAQQKSDKKVFPITKTEAEWKALLSEQAFYVLRKSATEQPFSSPLNKIHEKGVYVCAACNTPLFESDNKYDSKSGWPSFDDAINGTVERVLDKSHGMLRTEMGDKSFK
jgi:peptide-methionine (R)-S-oxide reductase